MGIFCNSCNIWKPRRFSTVDLSLSWWLLVPLATLILVFAGAVLMAALSLPDVLLPN